jgi:hypothetical protein
MSRANRDYPALNKHCQNQQKTTRSINIIEINMIRPENHHLRAPLRHLLLVHGRDADFRNQRSENRSLGAVASAEAAVLADMNATILRDKSCYYTRRIARLATSSNIQVSQRPQQIAQQCSSQSASCSLSPSSRLLRSSSKLTMARSLDYLPGSAWPGHRDPCRRAEAPYIHGGTKASGGTVEKRAPPNQRYGTLEIARRRRSFP